MSLGLLRRPYSKIIKPSFNTPLNLSNSVVDGMVGFWRLAEAGGTNPFDFSPSSHITAQFNGEPIWLPTIYGPGISFDGVDDRIDFATATTDPLAAALSFDEGSLWIRFKRTFADTIPDSATMFMIKDTAESVRPTERVTLFWLTEPDEWRCTLKTDAGSVDLDLSSGTMPQDKWNDFLLTWSVINNEFLIYLDGVLIDSGTHPGAATNPVRGVYWIDPRNPEGESILSDIVFWDRPLISQEAIQLTTKPYAILFEEKSIFSVDDVAAGFAALAGSLAYSITHSGNLQRGVSLVGALSSSLTHTGALQIGKLLEGALFYSLTHTGDLQIGKFLQGALAYSLTEAGNIQIGKFLAGALSYSLTHEGTLQVGGVDLFGDLSYSLTHTGAIQIGKFLAGALAYSLSHTGDIQIGKFLAGALIYSLTHQGTLSLDLLLAGDLDYSLTELGDIQIGQFLTGILNYSFTESGDLQIGKFLQGAFDYSLAEEGTLTLDILLSGSLAYSLIHTGQLQIGKFLDGTLNYSLTETGDLEIGVNLSGQETITFVMDGTLTVTAALFRVLIRINESLKTIDPANETLAIQKTVGETLIG